MKQQGKPFVLLCSPDELARQVEICRNSEYTVTEHGQFDVLVIMDGEYMVLSSQALGGMRMVKLWPRYYTHPFGQRRKEARRTRKEAYRR